MKSDLKDKLDNVKSISDFDKTKPLDAKLSIVLLVPVLPVNFLEILSARAEVFSFCFDAVLSLSVELE
jgi:hypothetical protein